MRVFGISFITFWKDTVSLLIYLAVKVTIFLRFHEVLENNKKIFCGLE